MHWCAALLVGSLAACIAEPQIVGDPPDAAEFADAAESDAGSSGPTDDAGVRFHPGGGEVHRGAITVDYRHARDAR